MALVATTAGHICVVSALLATQTLVECKPVIRDAEVRQEELLY